MGLYQQPGYKRLAIGIPIVVFVGMFFFALATDAGFGNALLAGAVFSAGAYALTRLVYWVVDGFKSHK